MANGEDEPDSIVKKLRDRAELLRLMDKHSDPQQSSEGTAVLLEEAAYQIERGARIYIAAVEGRQQFRMAFARLREGIQEAQSLVRDTFAHEGFDNPELTTLLNDLLAPGPRQDDDIVLTHAIDEIDALRIIASCAQQLADFVKKSVNVGPLTSNPRGEAYLWRALRGALANLP